MELDICPMSASLKTVNTPPPLRQPANPDSLYGANVAGLQQLKLDVNFMNKPFLSAQTRNQYRPYRWVIFDVRGNLKQLSGWFASEEAARKWMANAVSEFGPFLN